jgi:hypothetical protein
MEKNLLHKINELFELRGFPDLYKFSKINTIEINKTHNLLVELQASIYYLDEYLENNWVINHKSLNQHWKAIYETLKKLGIEKNQLETYCAQILKYQKHELDLRKNLLPTRLNTEFYYFYKSCDVKLMRRILLEKLSTLNSLFNSADWRYFDLVTEINDDVVDLEEDLHTINGNMVLICHEQFGRAATIDVFSHFLDYVMAESHKRFATTINPYKQSIHQKTVEHVIKTKKILTQNSVMKKDAESVLYHHLKSMRA